jgi:predicted MFS family arabinose efflux permease
MRLRVAALGVAIWSLATFASGLATTFAWLLLARALVGIGEATYTVVTPSLISDHYPAERRARALSIFYAAMPLGIAVAYVLGGLIGQHVGWRPAFMIVGGPGLLCAALLFLLREPPRGRFDAQGQAALKLPFAEFLRILKSRPSYFYNVAAQTFYTFTMGGLGVWMPTYFVRERHLGVDQAGTRFGGLLLVTGFLGTVIGGFVGDRLVKKHRGAHFTFSAATLIAAVPFSCIAVLSPNPYVYWSAMGMTLFCLFLNYGPLNAAMVNVLPGNARARGVGLHTTTIHLLGDAFSPFLIGLASDALGGLRIPILFTGALIGLAGMVLFAGSKALVRDLEQTL